MVVKNSLNMKTLKELVDYAKANPGKLTFGAGGGTGSSLYFATELLKSKAGINLNIANYKGAGRALNDLLGGHIDGMFDAMPVMAPQAKEGKVTPLAVTSAKRSPALPERADHQESGHPDYRDVRLVRHPRASRHAARRSRRSCATRWPRRSP